MVEAVGDHTHHDTHDHLSSLLDSSSVDHRLIEQEPEGTPRVERLAAPAPV
ncbi:hypothetical protein [Streptomyces sp. PSKA30]|uniref:hypothetical protein n=1 Tax=Streptomyces sp. PSKA30 TaxID=2874597 RepID=UPI001CD11AB3|nr:hypothetical protein [Streptomyces sp. PSKA30]MBZ9638699.1 hypothetical protein [Streptomyces sp. PSKA30]